MTSLPALFRTNDIGVSSEWRDLTLDWWPLLTDRGVYLYSFLRDSFDRQRNLRPFILDPDGPAKQRLQRVLQSKTEYAMRGVEYLLETIGLVTVEVVRGPSVDPDRPFHTTATYYVVGSLERPRLDWSTVDRVLDAVIIGLDPSDRPSPQQRRAQDAIQRLHLGGMLQNDDPGILFDPDGAWVFLLPQLIEDERWMRLFNFAHKDVNSLLQYQQAARRWVEYAHRRAERLQQENNRIGEEMLASQRRLRSPHVSSGTTENVPGKGSLVTQGGSAPKNVPGQSSKSPKGSLVTQGASGTQSNQSPASADSDYFTRVPQESQEPDQIKLNSWSQERPYLDQPGLLGTLDSGTLYTQESQDRTQTQRRSRVQHWDGEIPEVAQHIRPEELTTQEIGGYFWKAVMTVLVQSENTDQRYAYSAGERKAVQRLIGDRNIPIGIVLAALRAVMTLPAFPRPQSLASMLKLQVFHACVARAETLIPPSPVPQASLGGSWDNFIHVYRAVGQRGSLRDVSPIEWPLIADLFARHPTQCWEVLYRVQHADPPPRLSFAYLKKAVSNNMQSAAVRTLTQPAEQAGGYERTVSSQPSDERAALLEKEGVHPGILKPAMTLEFIQAWIAAADERINTIRERGAWLAWGIRQGKHPRDVPEIGLPSKLGTKQLSPAYPHSPAHAGFTPGSPANAEHQAQIMPSDQQTWQAVLRKLEEVVPRGEFDTWIKETDLLQYNLSELGRIPQAVIGTPNIFSREKLESRYRIVIARTLALVLGLESAGEVENVDEIIEVMFVINSSDAM